MVERSLSMREVGGSMPSDSIGAASPVVRIFAFQAKEPSSILGRRIDEHAPVAQWITRPPTERKIPGSTPGRRAFIFVQIFLPIGIT